jgi:hypothetical protein
VCMQCVGAVATAFNAATLVGGPIAAKHYQRIRAAFGLQDNSVAAVEAREPLSVASADPARPTPHAGHFDLHTTVPKPHTTSVITRRAPSLVAFSASLRS